MNQTSLTVFCCCVTLTQYKDVLFVRFRGALSFSFITVNLDRKLTALLNMMSFAVVL